MTIEEKAMEMMKEELKRAPKAFWNRTPEKREEHKASLMREIEAKELHNLFSNAEKAVYAKLDKRYSLKHYAKGRIYINATAMRELLKDYKIPCRGVKLKGFWIDETGYYEALDHGGKWDEPLVNEQLVRYLINTMVNCIVKA